MNFLSFTINLIENLTLHDSTKMGGFIPQTNDFLIIAIIPAMINTVIFLIKWEKIFPSLATKPKFNVVLGLVCGPFLLFLAILLSDSVADFLNNYVHNLGKTRFYVLMSAIFLTLPSATFYFNRSFMISSKDYFSKYGNLYTVKEYHLAKIFFFVTVSINLMLLTVFLIPTTKHLIFINTDEFFNRFVTGFWFMIGMIAFTSFLKIGTHLIEPEFRLYLTRAIFELVIDTKYRSQKIKLTLCGLSNYNKFLKRKFDLKFENTGYVMTAILPNSTTTSLSINEFARIFLQDDKLAPLEYLSRIMSNEKQFLKRISNFDKIKEIIIPMIAIIASIVSVVNSASSILHQFGISFDNIFT